MKNAETAILFKKRLAILEDIMDGKVNKDLKDWIDSFFLNEGKQSVILPYMRVKYAEEIFDECAVQKKNLTDGVKFSLPSSSGSGPQQQQQACAKVIATSAIWGNNDKPVKISDDSSSSSSKPSSKDDGEWHVAGKQVPSNKEMKEMAEDIFHDLLNRLAKIKITYNGKECSSFIQCEDISSSDDGTASLIVSRLERMDKNTSIKVIHELRIACIGTSTEGKTKIDVYRLSSMQDYIGRFKESYKYKTQELYCNGKYTTTFFNLVTKFWETYYPRSDCNVYFKER